MTDHTTKSKKSLAEIVFEAIQDLHVHEQIVTREVPTELTRLELKTIDERLGYLLDDGRIRRVQRGVFVPMEQHKPARPISRTLCPDGTTVLEVGDTVMILTPRESRMLGEVMTGAAQQFVAIEIGHEGARLNSVLSAQLSDVRRELRQFQDSPPDGRAEPV